MASSIGLHFFPSGISLVIQLCLYAISSGMIAGNVIRVSTFLEWAGREKSAAVHTKQSSAEAPAASAAETLTNRRYDKSSRQGMEAGNGDVDTSKDLNLNLT